MKEENIQKGYFKGDENPFSVPEGYFEESRKNILDLIGKEQVIESPKTVGLKSRLVWFSGIAASLLIGLFLFNSLYLEPKNDLKVAMEIDWLIDYSGAELDYVALASYVSDAGLDFEEDDDGFTDVEQTNLLEMTEFEEIYIIEEWIKSENQ